LSHYLAGTFSNKEATVEAINHLKASGFGPADLAVFSDEPVEFRRGILDRPSHMSLGVVSGAVLFFIGIVSFVYYTQNDYKLVTGGMPIFSFWPTGVVFYEITMLGAILTTCGLFIWESGLLRRDRGIPVPAIEPEVICLRVRCPVEQAEKVSAILSKAGGFNIVKLLRSR
jgi:hypothetical protein